MVITGSSVIFSRLSYTRNVIKNGNKAVNVLSANFNRLAITQRPYSTENVTKSQNEEEDGSETTEKISRAMRAYLERAKKHDEFIQKETIEFNIGKRHLANMMGENPESITQDDINKSIEYLFPSGLYDPKARPMMRPPNEIFPPRKAAEFDASGRPFHSMFYTSKPNYYQLLYDIVDAIHLLKHRKLASRNRESESTEEFSISGSTWLSKAELETILMELLIDKDYTEFLQAMERLVQYPGLHLVKDLLMKYRKPLMSQTENLSITPLEYTPEGRPFVTIKNCMRKSARGEVTILGKGSGKITINGQNILYFKDVQAREQIIFPLIFTGCSNNVDIEATVSGGGPSGQAGAIRWGISWGLRNFVPPEMVEKMRLAGLLKRDHRIRERKKPGQAGARKKFTWKKR